MRLACAVLALFLAWPVVVVAQEPAVKKPAAKKAAPKKAVTKARPQATPEQIRRFNELQKKQQAAKQTQ